MKLIGFSDKKILAALLSNLVIFTVGMGLFPILPLYTANLGLDRGAIGIFFGFIYLANTIGAISTSWISEKIPRQRLFILAGLIGAPAIALIGQMQTVWLVAMFTAIAWFTGGILLSLINVYIGLNTGGNKRGKSFSLTMLAIPLGALFGGTIVGWLIAWKGYELMFAAMGILWISHVLIGRFALPDEQGALLSSSEASTAHAQTPLGRSFFLLLALSLLTATAINASRLGTPLTMQAQGYSARAVASSATVSGLVTIPVTLLVGVLSDRLGRKSMLAMTYLIAASGALMLSLSSELWQFWTAATLMMVAFVSSNAMAAAMATDLLDPKALRRGLPWINAMTSLTGILTFSSTGYMMDMLGSQSLFMGIAVFPMAAMALLETNMRIPAQEQEPCRESIQVRDGRWVNECM